MPHMFSTPNQRIDYVITGEATVADPDEPKLDEKLKMMAARWREETAFDSSLSDVYNHPSYKSIMRTGEDGLPFVLRALRERPERWLHALRFMAPENPAEGIGDFEEARSAWITWGYKRNYL